MSVMLLLQSRGRLTSRALAKALFDSACCAWPCHSRQRSNVTTLAWSCRIQCKAHVVSAAPHLSSRARACDLPPENWLCNRILASRASWAELRCYWMRSTCGGQASLEEQRKDTLIRLVCHEAWHLQMSFVAECHGHSKPSKGPRHPECRWSRFQFLQALSSATKATSHWQQVERFLRESSSCAQPGP